jgi:transcriptional regulator with XRE-family HTH domain
MSVLHYESVMHTRTSPVAANIRAELARRDLGQKPLADALGISQSQLSKRLRGEIDLTVAELQKTAAFLEVPIGVLLPDPVVAEPAAS